MSEGMTSMTRRDVLRGASGAVLAGAAARAGAGELVGAPPSGAGEPAPTRPHVAVVGAGVFGASTALALRDRGARVTLVDAWGPGNSRSSSGGETRVIRAIYGADRVYTDLAVRAFAAWGAVEKRTGRRLLFPLGGLWMMHGEGAEGRDALPLLRDAGIPHRTLTGGEAAVRWPQVDFTGVDWVLEDDRTGYLLARRGCVALVEALVAAGGEFREVEARPGTIGTGGMGALRLGDGSTLAADAYVFACGPWLASLFPELLGEPGAEGRAWIRPTRQDVLFFGTPAGDRRFEEGRMPVWVDFGERVFYGIPGNERRGFKVADDTRGEPFDPTAGERLVRAESIARAREFLRRRFPALAEAPIVETRVCQYENSPDGDFLLDRHPAAGNAWIVGGGSGHGFKFGPAWGDWVAATVLGERAVSDKFALARFAPARAASTGGPTGSWGRAAR